MTAFAPWAGCRGRGDRVAAGIEDRDRELEAGRGRRADQGQRLAGVQGERQVVDVGRRDQHGVVGARVDQVAQRRNRRERSREGRGAQRDGEVGDVVAGQRDADQVLEAAGEEGQRVGVVGQVGVVDRQDRAGRDPS